MHLSDAGSIMVNTGSGCKSIPWFDWDVWSPWERALTLRTVGTQVFSVVMCCDVGVTWDCRQEGCTTCERGYWRGVGRDQFLPIELDTIIKYPVSLLAATQHVWLGSTWNVSSAKEEVHGLFILDEVEMTNFGRELMWTVFTLTYSQRCAVHRKRHSRYFWRACEWPLLRLCGDLQWNGWRLWEPQGQETPGAPGFIATLASWAEEDWRTLWWSKRPQFSFPPL